MENRVPLKEGSNYSVPEIVIVQKRGANIDEWSDISRKIINFSEVSQFLNYCVDFILTCLA